jgi:hypothetical protein
MEFGVQLPCTCRMTHKTPLIGGPTGTPAFSRDNGRSNLQLPFRERASEGTELEVPCLSSFS